MNRKNFSTIAIIIIFIFFDFIFFKITVHIGEKLQISIIHFLLSSVLLFLLLENLIYDKLFNLKSGKLIIFFYIICPLIISMLVTDGLQAIDKIYFISKSSPLKFKSNMWRFDKLLGRKAIPNYKGSFYYNFGDSIKRSIPVIFDSNGYRTVPDSLKLNSDTLDLYLGCSFTFGEWLEAQNTYPYLTSKLLKHNYINAAASGYGFGQMFQQVDSLTKKYKFKYVFIQLTTWLANRAMKIDGPAYGCRPYPYFSDDGTGFKLNPPAYSPLYLTNRINWRDTKTSYFERLQFIFADGIRTELGNYCFYLLAKLKTDIGLLQKPTKRKNDLERYFYDYTIDVCKKNNSIPIILKLNYPTNQCKKLLDYLKPKAEIIDLDYDIDQKINETGKKYRELFYIKAIDRNDSIVYDYHPNKFANELFSNRIYSKLKNK